MGKGSAVKQQLIKIKRILTVIEIKAKCRLHRMFERESVLGMNLTNDQIQEDYPYNSLSL
jgi:hypothetical protein